MLRFDDNGALLPPPVMSLPGEGMTITRIPLPDDVIRLEAIRVAASLKRDYFPFQLIESAIKFERYIRDGSPLDEDPRVWFVGPETSNQVMSIYSEGIAATNAEKYPETIYFFARLSN